MIKETKDSVIDPMESRLFVNIYAQNLGNSKPSKILPILKIIAKQYDYNLGVRIDYICAKRVLINCVLFN